MGRNHRSRRRAVARCVRVLQARGGGQGTGVRAPPHAGSGADDMSEPFVFGKTADGHDVVFRPAMANRHGLVTGATGTGKTVTLQVLTDHFSQLGVPVFLADVKSDLSGLAVAGVASAKMKER